MEAEIKKFEESIQHMNADDLIRLCVQQKRDICALENALKEYRASDTALARDHQKALQKIKDLEDEVKNLESALEHVSSQNSLSNRFRFGSHNEKMSAIHASHGEDIQDPLSEEQEPDKDGTKTKEQKVITFRKKDRTEEEIKQDGDREARAQARKLAREALGEARTKKPPTKMDYSGLPHTNTYDINAAELDKQYGEKNWEIAAWHKKDLIHQPVATHYVETIYTPVIKIRDIGKLAAQPQGDVLFKGSPVTPELLASIIYEKYYKSVPLYRQGMDLQNHGLFIPRQDMSNWIVRFSDEYLSVPYYYMQKLQCARNYGQCDESTLQVLHEEGRDAHTKSYVWVHTTGELDDGHPIVIFAYEPTRGTDHLRNYYAGFKGALSCDAYGAYVLLGKESSERITISGCLMHARRRFAEAFEIIKIGKLTKEQIEALPEYKALVLLGKIYEAEGKLKNISPEERLELRQSEVKPLVEDFYSFIEKFDETDPLLSEKMKEAVRYSLNQKERLCRFLEDGRIPCDNGYCENAIRIYAQGRRNWLFSNTPAGAEASVTIYSLIETARRNKANPLLYMKYLLEKTASYLELPSGSPRFEELMPWSEAYRKYEEAETQKNVEMCMPKSQQRPHYRPWQIPDGQDEKPSQLKAV